MVIEQCYPFDLTSFSLLAFDCFALDKNAPKYFGFTELICGLALALVIWTVADLRYKFRIETTALPIKKISLVIAITVGGLTLLTDYWRASQSRVPVGGLLTPESWQLLLGGCFFLVLATWFWLAFFRPSRFSTLNAKKFSQSIEGYLLRGSSSELAIVCDELVRSISRIVNYAPSNIIDEKEPSKQQIYALKILLAIGSPKFCRAIVEGAPKLIICLFNTVCEQNKYSDEFKIIAKNLLTAAIENRNSFLYNEKDFYDSGLEGITRPVISAFSQCPELIKEVDTLLSPEYSRKESWDLEQYKAYFQLLLAVFTIHARGNDSSQPSSLHWSYFHIRKIYSALTEDLQLNELKYNDDLYMRLETLGELIKKMVNVLKELKEEQAYLNQGSIDIADIIFDLIKAASSVRKPKKVSKKIHYSLIWMDILNSSELLDSDVGRNILLQVHSKLYNTIIRAPNLDGVLLIGYCLNVMGFHVRDEDEVYGSSWRELHIDFIFWLKQNIVSLFEKYPNIDQYCFVEGMSYDKQNNRLVNHYPNKDGSECDDLDMSPTPEGNPISEMTASNDSKSVSYQNLYNRLLGYLKYLFKLKGKK